MNLFEKLGLVMFIMGVVLMQSYPDIATSGGSVSMALATIGVLFFFGGGHDR